MSTSEDAGLGDANTPAPNTLLAIPLEMFEAIAEVVAPEDMPNLRLANRELKNKVNHTFVSTHFTERMFLLSYRESLQTLLAIARHEEFGRAVRTVFLCNEMLPDEDHVLTENGTCVDRWEPEGADRATLQIIHELQDREWRRLTEEQRRLVQDDADIHLLQEIFSAFGNLHNFPAIKLMDQAAADMDAYGDRTLRTLSARKLIWGMDRERPVRGPMAALSKSAYPLTSLTITYNNFGWNMYRFMADPELREHTTSVFTTTLKHLSLETRVEEDTPMNDTLAFAAMFGQCVALEHLSIEIWVLRDQMSGRRLVLNASFIQELFKQHVPRLRELRLKGFAMNLDALVAFSRRHEHLQAVSFDACWFITVEPYDDGIDNKKGRHDECVRTILQEATGIEHIWLSASVVLPWKTRENAASPVRSVGSVSIGSGEEDEGEDPDSGETDSEEG